MNSLHPLSTPHCGSNYSAKVLSVIKTASCMIIYQRLRRRALNYGTCSLARLLKLGGSCDRRKSNLKWAVKTGQEGQRTRKSAAICPYLPATNFVAKVFATPNLFLRIS